MSQPAVAIEAFLPFYTHVVPREHVQQALGAAAEESVVAEKRRDVLDGLWEQIVAVVEGHSARSVISAFHEFREDQGLPLTAESSEALRKFTARLEDPHSCEAILDRYPVLRRRMRTVVANMVAAFAEALTAWRDDRPWLAATFGLEAAESLAEVRPAGSDPHNDNRQVLFFTTTAGRKLVFKPRPLHIDDFARKLFAAVSPHLAHGLDGCVPVSLTVGEHGWQQLVPLAAMDTADQPERYFYRLGALTCLLGAVGATDLHDENVLAHGEYPCIVDGETLLRADRGVDNDSLEHLLLNQMKSSPLFTMLLPNVNPDALFDFVVAGVGVVGEQDSEVQRPLVTDAGTDAVRMEWTKLSYRHSTNLPRLGERELSVTDHYPRLVAGYRDALAFLRDHSVDAVLDAYPDMPIRTLLRSTEVYSRYMDAATHPKYLTGQEATDRLFALLNKNNSKLPEAETQYLKGAERAAMDSGNVPLYHVTASGTELATHAGHLDGFYTLSPLDHARRGLAMATERSDAYHQFLLEESIAEIVGAPEGLSAHSVFAPALAGAEPGTWSRRIADTLADLAVTLDLPDGPRAGWIGGIGPDRGAATVTPGSRVSFHDFGGIPRALAFTHRRGEDAPPIVAAAHRGLATLTGTYTELLDKIPESVFSGTASLLLSRTAGVDTAWLDGLLEKIGERGEDRETDLANGPAGLLMVLAWRLEHGERHLAPYLTALRPLAFPANGRPLPGQAVEVAHGELGLQWAKARLGRVTGEQAATDEAFDWLAAHIDRFDTGLTGWCKGAAGQLVAAAEIARSAGRAAWLRPHAERLADRAVTLPDEPVDLSVCHGSSGVVQCLLAAASFLEDRELADRARPFQHRVLDTARRRGFSTGAAGRTSLLGYMLGWSGIAESDAMLDEPHLPSGAPLALTV
ncbi:type 2 lanthipeptide synthetase LanM [Streptomyces sp. NPDC001118]|uniref:type 2 lanthipeptide synthetase LanM n=1 Tax=Streptomyces sp. NPDC002589 TaxID=3154420 RepID=UPI00332842E3